MPLFSSAPMAPRPNTMVLLGDSITAQNSFTSATLDSSRMDSGFWNWAQALSGHRFRLLNNAGVGSDNSTQMLARVQAGVMSHNPSHCCVMGGTNDANGGDPAAVIPNLRAIYESLVAAGVYVFALTILPRPTAGAAQQKNILTVNRWIADYWRDHGGGECVDLFSAIIDPASTGQAVRTGALADNVHLSNLGGYLTGKKLATALSRWPQNDFLVSSAQDSVAVNAQSDNVPTNPMFNTTNGGQLYVLTGTSPQGWVIAQTGGGGGAASNVASPDGIGNAVQLDATGATNGETVILGVVGGVMGAGKLAVGDSYYFEIVVQISNPVNLKRVWSYTNGGSSGVAVLESGSASQNCPEGVTALLRSPVKKIALGTASLAWEAITLMFSGVGSCTAKIYRPAVRKYTYAG